MDYRRVFYTTIDRLSTPSRLSSAIPPFKTILEKDIEDWTEAGIKELKIYLVTKVRKLLSGASPSMPGRPPGTKTGKLVRAVYSERRGKGTKSKVILGLRKPGFYGPLLDRGTGIYGPSGHPIVPRRRKFLKFYMNGRVIYTRSVKGTKRRPWIFKATKIFKEFKRSK